MSRAEYSDGLGAGRAVTALITLALAVALAPFGTAQARIFFDNADPALNGATIVPLDDSRFFPGQSSALLMENGHDFQFAYHSVSPIPSSGRWYGAPPGYSAV